MPLIDIPESGRFTRTNVASLSHSELVKIEIVYGLYRDARVLVETHQGPLQTFEEVAGDLLISPQEVFDTVEFPLINKMEKANIETLKRNQKAGKEARTLIEELREMRPTLLNGI